MSVSGAELPSETEFPSTEEILQALADNDENARQVMDRLAPWSESDGSYSFDEPTAAQIEFVPGLPIKQTYAPWPEGREMSPISNPTAIPVRSLKPTITEEGEPAFIVIGKVGPSIGDGKTDYYRTATVSIAGALRDGHRFRVVSQEKAV